MGNVQFEEELTWKGGSMAQMKDSGIAWIGEIPNEWLLKKLDYMSISYSGGTPDRDNFSYWDNGTINWMSSGEVNKRLVYDTDEKISIKGLRNSSAKLYPENTVMFAMNGQGKTKGMTAILKTISSGNQSLVGFICDEKELHYRYLDYCFQASYKYNRSYYGGGDNRDGIAASNIKKMKLPVPPYKEQIEISKFLDSEVIKLDKIIADAQKSLEILQETRKSIIFETVTRGLKKDRELKDSGIAWIGEIPSEWLLKKLDYMSISYSGGTPDRDNFSYWDNGTINWMSSGEVNKKLVYDTDEKISIKGLRNSSAKLYPENTVMFAMNGQGKTKGMTAILKTISSGNQSLVGFICDEKELHYRYLDYCFQASYKYNRSYYGGGDNRDGIAASNIKKMKLPVPPYKEQIEISKFLDNKVVILDKVICKVKKIIELAEQTKKSLIYEYVTGKERVEV